jgi:hypothetical protein
MSGIYIRGTRENIAGLLRLMADEVEQDGHSATGFSEHPGEDPWHALTCEEEDQPYDTTMQVVR